MNLQITEKDLKMQAIKKSTVERVNKGAKIKLKLLNAGLLSTNHEDQNSEHLYRYRETVETASGSKAYIFDHLPTNGEMVFII